MLGYIRTSDTSQAVLKCLLYPSPSFLSKNHLAKEGPDSVAPVVIPALALDLRYCLNRTSDLRQNKEFSLCLLQERF